MRRLTAPSKVAEFLALNPGISKYQIAKETGLSYSRVHESIEGGKKDKLKNPGLEKLGFVKAEIAGKTRAGLDKKTYTLTLKGMLNILYYRKELWGKLDIVIANHKSLGSLVFRKWDHFVKVGARKFLIFRLKNAVRLGSWTPLEPDFVIENKAFDEYFLCMDPLLSIQFVSKKDIAAWIKALSTDSELAGFVKERNKKLIRSRVRALEFQNAYDKAIQQNRPELFLSKFKTSRSSIKEEGKKERKEVKN